MTARKNRSTRADDAALNAALLDNLSQLMRDLRIDGASTKGGWAEAHGRFKIIYGRVHLAGEQLSLLELVQRERNDPTLTASRKWCEHWLEDHAPTTDDERPGKGRRKGAPFFSSVPPPEREQILRRLHGHGGDWLDHDFWRRYGVREPAQVVRVWEYKTETGRLEFLNGRVEQPGQEKKFAQVAFFGDDDEGGAAGWRRVARQFVIREPIPLYNLPALREHPDRPVLVVEGEKAANAAAVRFTDYVATTWLGGALSTTDATGRADWSPIAGRSVVVWPDHDEDGAGAADRVVDLLHAAGAAEVRRVRLPPDVFPTRWDLADELPDGVTDDDLRQLLDNAERVEPDRRPIVRLEVDQLDRAVKETEAALCASAVQVYQRAGQLVRIFRVDRDTPEAHVRRRVGALVIKSVKDHWLRIKLGLAARFERCDGRRDEWVPCDPGLDFARSILAGEGEWPFPVLVGIGEAPTLRADLSPVEREGYDPDSALYLDFGGARFPPIADAPTRTDAERALARLVEPFACFPFVPDQMTDGWQPTPDEGSRPSAARSVVLSAVLTGLIRRTLRTAPIHAIDATVRGSGKTMLAGMVGAIVTGREPVAISQARDPEEERKQLHAVLSAGDPIILIDNVERPIDSPELASITTSERWSARVLGSTEMRDVNTNALFLVTGNNLSFVGDLTRRVVKARLDPRTERPDTRHFKFDPLERVRENRVALVVAGLTLLRAYAVAGRSLGGKLLPFGSFADWDLVREALVWLDQPDPADTREEVIAEDPEADLLREVMVAWEIAHGDQAVDLDVVIRKVKNTGGYTNGQYNALAGLFHAFAKMTRGDRIEGRSVGRWFKRQHGRVLDGRYFSRTAQLGRRGSLIKLCGAGRPTVTAQLDLSPPAATPMTDTLTVPQGPDGRPVI